MTRQSTRLAAIAGGIAVAAAGLFVLGNRSAQGQGAIRTRGRTPAASPHRAVAGLPGRSSGDTGSATVARAPAPIAAPKADSEAVRGARALFERLERAAGRPATLPEDLRRDLLAFLSGGDENRAALFQMVWAPGSSRMVLGHLKLFLLNLEDGGTRSALLASLDSFDPQAGLRGEVAARSRDPELLAADLRAMPAGEPKVHLLQMLSKETLKEDSVRRLLLDAARDDADESIRTIAYAKLAEGAVPGAPALYLAAASDAGRSARERQMAAYALSFHPEQAPADELFRLWDGSPDEVRIHLLVSLAQAGPSARVDDLLLETLVSARDDRFRKQAANAIGMRLYQLPAEAARDLGSRTAEVLKGLSEETTATALRSLGGVVVDNQPLREAVVGLHRTSTRGGAIQVAIASSPALRMAVGL
jgi:hypothetical protein